MIKMRTFKDSVVNKINREVISYVQGQFDNGHDGYSDDILLYGLQNKEINISMDEFIEYDEAIFDLMDLNFGCSNFELAGEKFILYMIKRNMFSFNQLYRIFKKYYFTKATFNSYVTIEEGNKLVLWKKIEEYRIEREELETRKGR